MSDSDGSASSGHHQKNGYVVITKTTRTINSDGQVHTEQVTEQHSAKQEFFQDPDMGLDKDFQADFQKRFEALKATNGGQRSAPGIDNHQATEKKNVEATQSDQSSTEDENDDSEFSKYEVGCRNLHNQLRAKHGVPPLQLSKKLCAYAQEWADKLAATNTFQHRSERRYGENIFCSSSSKPTKPDPAAPVQSWYDEVHKHQFGGEPRSSGTGHFTQVVWKASQQLGVGVATAGGRVVVVANYYPPGNFLGKYQENVPPPLH